ncbi:MAG TPA: thioredoxin family protein [Desulfovibrio sp.]|jgi:small redox-active disulfide protein 2|uniref:thioredoxin family protein n=1 Tax=Desulfovibrio sp. TaxID=885 RepID=UPI002C817B3E|nr:thioredoxin family protein [Desulfovibrio sp.]HMM37538.1 thioredoxin family protein [Desulfovibrio sp.]
MDIKVLGPGCAKCKEAEKVVREAVAAAGVDASVEKITDFQQMMQYGVMSTPAVVVDGEVKVVGKVPSRDDVLAWIKK